MRTGRLLLLCVCWAGVLGCSSADYYQTDRGPFKLSEVTQPSDRTQTYQLICSSNHKEILLVERSEFTEQRAELGIEVVEIDKERSLKYELTPYSGLFISEVALDSQADKVGLIPGDILLSIGGTDVIYMEQYEHVTARLAPGDEVVLKVWRGRDPGTEKEFSLKAAGKPEQVISTKSIPLEQASDGGTDYTGMVCATLPAEWTAKVFGEEKATVLLAGVYVGSPAYRAGIRGGDRIVTLGGQSFQNAIEMKSWLQEMGERGESVPIEVFRGREGIYTAEIDLDDWRGEAEVYFPFVLDFAHSYPVTEWTVGPLGIVASYDGHYWRSDTRKANYTSSLSFLLGLFSFSWSPEGTQTRLLWFINIEG